MDSFVIRGGVPLRGTVEISGAKNAALPILCVSMLAEGVHFFRNVPRLNDIDTTIDLVRHMGAEVEGTAPVLKVSTASIDRFDAPYELVKKMRASVLVLGPLLARFGEARVSLPGGCAIGARPIDQHLKGLEALGAEIRIEHGFVLARAKRLRGAEIVFDLQTVGGTENLMMAAVLAEGRTTMLNCAKEPEIEELARVLNKMGANVQGAGTDTIHIEGVRELRPVDHAIIPDRIEAGPYMAAAAATGGDVLLHNCRLDHLESVAAKIAQAGAEVSAEGQGVRVRGKPPFRACDVTTLPYPGFPTDMQAQFMVLMCLAAGESVVTETVFENRFMHVPELCRMGADVEIRGRAAVVRGVPRLSGAQVMCSDLRASAALVIAGLVAEGETRLARVYHIDRGYEDVIAKLAGLGGHVQRVKGEA
ncbi:MAG: UDP-N-acetylglucosamine 1-carboxyvinyltransferase [Deltaproteobacteria bacterium]|nr:UDP-N-acetylglucosamine 1-carboxyvinyltransferase [Deltaproteobacteria bacterium]